MRQYEIAFILVPTLSDDEVEQSIATYREVAEEKGAQVVKVDEWGKRRLAYPINKHKEGIYTIFTLEEPEAEAVGELERRFKVTESVIRFLSVRIDLDLKRMEKFKSRREKRNAILKGRSGEEKDQSEVAKD